MQTNVVESVNARTLHQCGSFVKQSGALAVKVACAMIALMRLLLATFLSLRLRSVAAAVTLTFSFAGYANAALTVQSIDLNNTGSSTVTVGPGATVAVRFTVRTSQNTDWSTTRVQLSNLDTCLNIPNPNVTANNTTAAGTFNVTAPTAGGSYNLRLTASSGTTCGGSIDTAQGVINVDATAPTVTSIVRASANPSSAGSVQWTVTFSESVTGVTASNFSLVNTGLGGTPAITSVTGSGTTWTVTASTGTNNGSLGLNATSAGGITDLVGNALTGLPQTGQVYTLDRQPTVTSILRAGSNPTASTSVQWIVTFNKTVTGVSAANFSLVNSGLGGTPAITTVTGSGTTWTVEATTGTGNGSLGLNLTSAGTVVDSGGNSLAGLPAVGEVYTIDQSRAGCYVDDFNRTSGLGPDWATTTSSGTFGQPVIVNNRLRLTDSSNNVASAAHLQRFFPGAGNKIVVEFDYFAYDGSGADGVAVTLSDASIAPAAGAFGGSLGYAQKSNPGSDCTKQGGCPGFAGGWLGVGIDEYGLYSDNSEGRNGGSVQIPDSVAVRGSGSGQVGYAFQAGTASLSTGVDSSASTSPAPGHRYRITVDHSDNVHAYVTVDRDTTASKTGYTNIIPTYDAKSFPEQAAVPGNWILSYTSSTGSATNIHEIDNLSVCAAQPPVKPTLDHVRIVHDGSALTCAPETLTLKACADPECSSLYLGSVTVDLATISGATWSADPVTFTGGQRQITLTKTSTGTVTIGGTVTSMSPTQSVVCYNGGTANNCALSYTSNSCAFDAVESGKAPSTPLYTKLAGIPFSVDVLALTAGAINTGYQGTVNVALVDQTGVAAGACGTTVLASPTTPASPYAFSSGDAGRKTFTFSYPNGARDVRVRITSGSTVACSSDNFAIRPTSFTVASSDATNTGTSGTPVFKAGSDFFSLDAISVNNYSGTAKINANRVAAQSGAVQNGTLSGVFSPASVSTSWRSRGTAFTYSEVGQFQFLPWGVYDDGSFADVDRLKATRECFIDNKLATNVDPSDPNVKDANGMYGCYFGGTNTSSGKITSGYFGRFIPDHFGVSGTLTPRSDIAACAASTFTYIGEPMTLNLTLTAQNAANGTTQNYTGVFDAGGTSVVKLNPASFANLKLAGADRVTIKPAGAPQPPYLFPASRFSTTGLPAVTCGTSPCFQSGVAANISVPFFVTRPTGPEGDYANVDLGVAPVDSDNVTVIPNMDTTSTGAPSAPGDRRKVVTTALRYGRMRIDNGYGSELLALPVNIEAQYWNGISYVRNVADSCTPLISANFSTTQGAGATVATSVVGSTSLTGGVGKIQLSKPSNAVSGRGSVVLKTNSAQIPYLPGTGTETFGLYKSGPVIYLRELY